MAVDATKANKVKLRVYNLSPETDGLVRWYRVDEPDKVAGEAHYFMKPYHKGWQEVVCHIDGRWEGVIDHISIIPGLLTHRGDIWIDWIAISNEEPRPPLFRPDVHSEKVVPRITIPGITQADFQLAFDVLDECLIIDVPYEGSDYPMLAPASLVGPGRSLGPTWCGLDSSVSLSGVKWANQEFAENHIRGFMQVQSQNPDGRIDIAGCKPIRGGCSDLSAMPRYLEAAYDIARRSGDRKFREDVCDSIRDYIDWWLSPAKRDPKTGLVTGFYEETLSHTIELFSLASLSKKFTIAPIDLNVAVAVGCYNMSKLAGELGRAKEAKKYSKLYNELSEAINKYMWNEEDGLYYSYNIKTSQQYSNLLSSTCFDVFRLHIAPEDRAARMIPKLIDPAMFNWGTFPLTTVAKTHPDYSAACGDALQASLGGIWTGQNMMTVAALEDIARDDLAAELAWKTIKIFNGRYAEWLSPSGEMPSEATGSLHYCWTASLYIAAIIEHLFGIDYDRQKSLMRIHPRIPRELEDETISISRLILPTGMDTRLNLTVSPMAKGAREFLIRLEGEVPKGKMEVLLPIADNTDLKVVNADTGEILPVFRNFEQLKQAAGVRLALKREIRLRFELR